MGNEPKGPGADGILALGPGLGCRRWWLALPDVLWQNCSVGVSELLQQWGVGLGEPEGHRGRPITRSLLCLD